MAKKIEGMAHQYAERNLTEDGDTRLVAGDSFSATRPGTMYTVSGTLVIHDGPHEPVYTASEVRAMLKEIVDAREAVRNSPEGMVWATPRQDIEVIASKHGINIADVAVPKADHA